MKYIRIKTVANGYLAAEDLSMDRPTEFHLTDPYVFESFGNLVEWIKINLDIPEKHKPKE